MSTESYSNSEKEYSLDEMQEIADQLDELQKQKNNGEGIEHVRWIVQDLRNGDFKTAQNNYDGQSDKYGNHPEIVKFLEEVGIARNINWNK